MKSVSTHGIYCDCTLPGGYVCVCVCAWLSKGYSLLWRVCVAYDAGLLQPLHSCNGNMHAARCTMLRAFSEFHEIALPTHHPPRSHTHLCLEHCCHLACSHLFWTIWWHCLLCWAHFIHDASRPLPTLATPAHSRSLSHTQHSQPAAITPSIPCPWARLLCIGPARLQFNF